MNMPRQKSGGALFTNDHKSAENQPDFRGDIELTHNDLQLLIQDAQAGLPVKITLSGWKKQGQGGQYVGLAAERRDDSYKNAGGGGQQQPAPQQQQPFPQQGQPPQQAAYPPQQAQQPPQQQGQFPQQQPPQQGYQQPPQQQQGFPQPTTAPNGQQQPYDSTPQPDGLDDEIPF